MNPRPPQPQQPPEPTMQVPVRVMQAIVNFLQQMPAVAIMLEIQRLIPPEQFQEVPPAPPERHKENSGPAYRGLDN